MQEPKPGKTRPETELSVLLRDMSPALDPEGYVFAGFDGAAPDAVAGKALMRFREEEGDTLILSAEDAAGVDAQKAFACRKITLRIHSSLEAVGFMAAITQALARAGVPANAVSAFRHDHLFVPDNRAADALAVLEALSAEARKG